MAKPHGALAKHVGRRVRILWQHQNGAPEGLGAEHQLFVSWIPAGIQLLAQLLLAVVLQGLDDFGPELLCGCLVVVLYFFRFEKTLVVP